MKERWYFDNIFRYVIQDDEHDEEKKEEVKRMVGSSVVAALVPIVRANSNSTPQKKKAKITLNPLKQSPPQKSPVKSNSLVDYNDEESGDEIGRRSRMKSTVYQQSDMLPLWCQTNQRD